MFFFKRKLVSGPYEVAAMLSYWDPFLGLEFLWFSFRRSQPFWLLFLPLLISSISRAFWSLRIFQTLKLYGWDLNCSSPIRFHFNNEDRVHLAQRQWSTEWTDTGPCKAILSSFQIFPPPPHFFEKIDQLVVVYSWCTAVMCWMSLFCSNPILLFH